MILFIRTFESYTDEVIRLELGRMGVAYKERTYYTPEDVYEDDTLLRSMISDIESDSPDAVFTVNFWPLVARACHSLGIKYIAWSYDCPQNLPTDRDMDYPENYIFLFDRWEAEDYRQRGLTNVYHMPLAVSTAMWDKAVPKADDEIMDISFVGSIYESTFPGLCNAMEPYEEGFFRGIADAQRKVYGYYMVDELITDEHIKKVDKLLRKDPDDTERMLRRRLSYSIGTYITFQDRLSLLTLLSKRAGMHFYTGKVPDNIRPLMSDVKLHGYVNYESEMPLVFKRSRINLCPTLRVIRTGIPLRILDILGCGGFLLTSYQSELGEYFTSGRELVMYGSLEEALYLAEYYLTHEDERQEIAAAGYDKVARDFTYEDRFSRMFEIAGL